MRTWQAGVALVIAVGAGLAVAFGGSVAADRIAAAFESDLAALQAEVAAAPAPQRPKVLLAGLAVALDPRRDGRWSSIDACYAGEAQQLVLLVNTIAVRGPASADHLVVRHHRRFECEPATVMQPLVYMALAEELSRHWHLSGASRLAALACELGHEPGCALAATTRAQAPPMPVPTMNHASATGQAPGGWWVVRVEPGLVIVDGERDDAPGALDRLSATLAARLQTDSDSALLALSPALSAARARAAIDVMIALSGDVHVAVSGPDGQLIVVPVADMVAAIGDGEWPGA